MKKKINVKLSHIHIVEVTDTYIRFNDDSMITFDHAQDCCEYNYADFEQLDDIARNYNFQTPLQFEAIDHAGFRFGDGRAMFFIPCYSSQNGYYTADIDIYYNNQCQLSFTCEEDFY